MNPDVRITWKLGAADIRELEEYRKGLEGVLLTVRISLWYLERRDFSGLAQWNNGIRDALVQVKAELARRGTS